MSETSHSVSVWIERLRQNDPQAARVLWQRFFPRMVAVARRRLGDGPRRAADEEDAALAAFADFDRAVKAGRFPDLHDRDGLWALLLTFTLRKVQVQLRDERRRGGEKMCGDSAGPECADPERSHEEEVAFQDGLDWLLRGLSSAELAQIALRKLEGYSNDQIAEQLDCARSTVERRLRLIRETWRWLLEET